MPYFLHLEATHQRAAIPLYLLFAPQPQLLGEISFAARPTAIRKVRSTPGTGVSRTGRDACGSLAVPVRGGWRGNVAGTWPKVSVPAMTRTAMSPAGMRKRRICRARSGVLINPEVVGKEP